METYSITDKQGTELCDNIGKMLVIELETANVRQKVKRIVADYVNKRDIGDDPDRLMRRLDWSVKVKLK